MDQVINAVVLGSIYSMFAVGISLPWATLNVLNLAHGAVFTFSVFAVFYARDHIHWHMSFGLALVIAVAVGIVLEVTINYLVFEPIRTRASDPQQAELLMLIGSVGVAAILVGYVSHDTQSAPFSLYKSSYHNGSFHIGGTLVTYLQLYIVLVGVALMVVLAIWLRASRLGRALRGVAVDPQVCELMGISRRQMSLLVLVISGGSAGLAAVFLGTYLVVVDSSTGSSLLLTAFAVAVLGGVGSIWGSLLGAFVLAGGETLVTATTSGTWTSAIAFGVIVVILMYRPQGLFGWTRVDRV